MTRISVAAAVTAADLCCLAETQRISPQPHPPLRKVSVSESNVLLDEEVLTDPKTQALLLTVLVRMPCAAPSSVCGRQVHQGGLAWREAHT